MQITSHFRKHCRRFTSLKYRWSFPNFCTSVNVPCPQLGPMQSIYLLTWRIIAGAKCLFIDSMPVPNIYLPIRHFAAGVECFFYQPGVSPPVRSIYLPTRRRCEAFIFRPGGSWLVRIIYLSIPRRKY